MTPEESIKLLVALIVATPPPFSEDEISTALQESGLCREIAARSYSFALIACGRILIKDIGATFSDDYFCFDSNGNTTETGKLDEEPYFRATNDIVGPSDIGNPSLTHFAIMAAELHAINELLNRGSNPVNIVTTPAIIFLEPPTGVGMFMARKTIALHTAEGLRNSARSRPWWKFW